MLMALLPCTGSLKVTVTRLLRQLAVTDAMVGGVISAAGGGALEPAVAPTVPPAEAREGAPAKPSGSESAKSDIPSAANAAVTPAPPKPDTIGTPTARVQSDPPGALVYLNGEEVGRTPLAHDFLWYGNYDVELRSEPGRGVTVQIVLPCRT